MDNMSKLEEVMNKNMKLSSKDRGCMMFARIQGITYAVKNFYGIFECSQEEFDELLAFLQATSVKELEKLCSDEQIFKYRSVNDTPMKGLVVSGDDKIVVNFQDLPEDHMVPEIIQLQKNYVIHRMIPLCWKKILGMMNRKMTQGELENMKPNGLHRMTLLLDSALGGARDEELAKSELDAHALEKLMEAEAAKRKAE